MFDKILIANRGEIACRIIATCRRLGIASVAVYSDADADALHVRLADEALNIGPAAARDSYLNSARLIQAARDSGAQAVHPGYGFLAENASFARAVAAAGRVFIGPPPAAIEAMGSKATARELMQRCGVPVLPGYQGERQDGSWLRAQAERIGYPVLIKAVAGGGGKGMRAVPDAASFEANLSACQREAAAAFADARVLLEKYLPAPRHIEVQIFGDAAGSIVHLHERDCSAQRRHQKVLEEAPAPGLKAAPREGLARAACAAGRAVGYTGAGTVEFLLDTEGRFYFIEMNTRIQVEHAVSEMITGIDLVEWQLRVAALEPLPRSQPQIQCAGHAIEARLYAESPEAGFLPSSGRLRRFELPAPAAGLRLETGVQAGDRIGIDYDPLLAKLIVHADTRPEAIAALQAALAQVRIGGVASNLLFLRRLIASAPYRRGGIDTEFIEREPLRAGTHSTAAASERPELELEPEPALESVLEPEPVLAAAALWLLAKEAAAAADTRGRSPWQCADGWRLNGELSRTLRFDQLSANSGAEDTGAAAVQVRYCAAGIWLEIGARRGAASLTSLSHDLYEVRFAERACRVQILEEPDHVQVIVGLQEWRLRYRDPLQVQTQVTAAETRLVAPMPGRIIAQLVSAGAAVGKGAALLIMEAMKMEHTLCAPADGTVRGYRAAVGAQVEAGTELIDFEPRAVPQKSPS